MPQLKPPRPGEVVIDLPDRYDAGIHFIGRIRTLWKTTGECPKNSRSGDGALATLELDQRYAAGLQELSLFSHAIVLYWLDQSRRDLIAQVPSHLSTPRGTFALRSPVRPNPIGLSVVEIVGIHGARVDVRNIDCVDNTPLIDLKPYYASLDAYPDAKRP